MSPVPRILRRLALAVLVPAMATLSACGISVENPAPLPPPQQAVAPYVIQPGDSLDVRFFYNPELNEEVTVRPDGDISLPLAGQVKAAGQTPLQLEDALKERYATELRQAAITVMVKGFAGQRVYVAGEVTEPKMVNITGDLTALQAVTSAGGFKPSGRVDQVLVIRRNGTPRPTVIPLDLEKAIDGRDTRQDINLEPYDVVYVPKTKIAEVDAWVDQYVRQLIPAPFGIGYAF